MRRLGDHLTDPWHPDRQRAFILELLRANRVVPLSLLQRWGLEEAAMSMGLPSRILSGLTRSRQPHSLVEMTFLAFEQKHFTQEAFHLAGVVEMWMRIGDEGGKVWKLVDARGRERSRMPDAELVMPGQLHTDTAIEFDAGYSMKTIHAKLKAFAAVGYSKVMWGTAEHARVKTLAHAIVSWVNAGDYPANLKGIQVAYVNYWSTKNPYIDRARCHKSYFADIILDPKLRLIIDRQEVLLTEINRGGVS